MSEKMGAWKPVVLEGIVLGHECGVCGERSLDGHDGMEVLSNYCPNYGAKMSKEEAVEKKIGVPDWKPEDEREKIEKMFESFVIDGKKWTVIEDWHWLNETSFIVTAKAQDEDGNVMQANRQADEAEDWSKFKRKADDEQT